MTVKGSWRRSLFTSVAAAHVRVVEGRVTSRKPITRFLDLGATTCVFIAAMRVEISC